MRMRNVVTLVGLVVLGVGIATGGTAAAKNGPPLIDLQGSSYTQTISIVGNRVIGQLNFTIDARKLVNGSMNGSFSFQQEGCLTNGSFDPGCSGPDQTLYEVASEDAKIACLAADANTRTVWVSGPVVDVSDLRIAAWQLQQEQSILAQKKLIVIARFQDTNGDGIADVRSLFITLATAPYPNASPTTGDIESPWYINALGFTSGANACLQRDNAFQSADYQVVNGATNSVQWLEPDDSTPVGSPITGTAANMANPPAASLYSLAPLNRTLLSPNLTLTIRS